MACVYPIDLHGAFGQVIHGPIDLKNDVGVCL